MRFAYGVLVTFLLSLLVGCGGGDGNEGGLPSPAGRSDEQQIQDVYDAFVDALRDGDGGAGCKLLSTDGKAGVLVGAAFLGEKPESCADAVEQLAAATSEEDLEQTELTDITITGRKATASPAADDPGGEQFEKIGDRWLLSSAEGE